jgi:serine/threonine protein kinase
MLRKYPFVRELGRGGFGWVFHARAAESGQDVAVKLLSAQDDAQKERFARELRILREQLNNRYVVDILDADLSHVPPYIVLEYCEDGSLRRWVGERHSWSDVAGALLHATLGLNGLHSAGGFHRDIKPDNLLLGRNGTERVVKVADFGVARTPLTVGGTMTQSAWGTDGYFAPEVKSGLPHSAAADIYALGVTGIELLTGSTNPRALAAAAIPNGLRELLEQMVAATPAQRPSTQALAQSLRALYAPTPPAPRREPPPSPQTSSSNGSDVGWGALLAFAGIAAAVAALASNDSATWDKNVGRYRGSDGRFR